MADAGAAGRDVKVQAAVSGALEAGDVFWKLRD
jgi:hypothetical protein